MSTFTVLSQEDEDALHSKRLLNIEEKTYKRVQKRLLAPTNPIQQYLRRDPNHGSSASTSAQNGSGETVSEEDDEGDTIVVESTHNKFPNTNAGEPQSQESIDAYLKSLEEFKHAVLHDFSGLTTNLARLQFLLNANERERQRYAQQARTITEEHASIKDDTSNLRVRLDQARDLMEVRKGYDVLAEKVLWVDGKVGGQRAKTREELGRESQKLRAEIEELEREADELNQQWVDRRTALRDVIDEAGRLRRVVRGEPEHVEEDKKEDDDARSHADEEDGDQKRREDDADIIMAPDDRDRDAGISHAGTPRPVDDGGATPMHHAAAADSGGMTPRSIAGDADPGSATPLPADAGSSLKQEFQTDSQDAEMTGWPEQQQQQDLPTIVEPEAHVDDAEKAELAEMHDS